jgi:hypothetical protein
VEEKENGRTLKKSPAGGANDSFHRRVALDLNMSDPLVSDGPELVAGLSKP